MPLTFANPRTHAEFDNWPCGGTTVRCIFQIEYNPARGYRVARTTTNRHGVWCKPKYTTYSGQAAIVDGSDGRTYILQYAGSTCDFVTVRRHDFLDATRELGREPGKGAS